MSIFFNNSKKDHKNNFEEGTYVFLLIKGIFAWLDILI